MDNKCPKNGGDKSGKLQVCHRFNRGRVGQDRHNYGIGLSIGDYIGILVTYRRVSMRYMGSKNRIAKYILPIMLAKRKPDQWWVEPFVGGGNMIDKVAGKRIGSDLNYFAIDALYSIRDHIDELPVNNFEFTEADYKKLKQNDFYLHKGYAGFTFSYSGKWLGGWSRDKDGKRDYVKEAYRNARKQSAKLQGVELANLSYFDLPIPPSSLIYCDPPYSGTTQYHHADIKDDFNPVVFWQWCREKAGEGHTVFVSEYSAPDDFKCVWSKEIVSSLTKNTGGKIGTEKLFTL